MPVYLTSSRFAQACLVLLALCGAGSSSAVALTDFRAEDLLPMAGEARKALNLNANQQTLWSQVEAKSRAVLRERTRRREALQAHAKALLARPDVELRDLDREAEKEAAATQAENQQIRAMWLDVNDALDDAQRRQVAGLLSDQLMRVVPEHRGGGDKPSGPRNDRGRRGGAETGRDSGSGPGARGGASLNIGG